jgi:hypothetical protein
MTTSNAKKFLTPEELAHRKTLMDKVQKNAIGDKPKKEDFTTNVTTDIGQKHSGRYGCIKITTAVLEEIAKYRADGYSVSIELDSDDCPTIFAKQKVVGMDSYNEELARWEARVKEINDANDELQKYAELVEARKKEHDEKKNALPTDVAELQAMVMQLMGKIQ